MNFRAEAALVFSLLFATSDAAAAQLRLLFGDLKTGRLIGRVSDARTGRPVAAAAISAGNLDEAVESNRRGHFVLAGLPVGEYELKLGNCTIRGHGCRLYGTRSGVGVAADGCEMNVLLDGLPVVRGSSRFRTSAAASSPSGRSRPRLRPFRPIPDAPRSASRRERPPEPKVRL